MTDSNLPSPSSMSPNGPKSRSSQHGCPLDWSLLDPAATPSPLSLAAKIVLCLGSEKSDSQRSAEASPLPVFLRPGRRSCRYFVMHTVAKSRFSRSTGL